MGFLQTSRTTTHVACSISLPSSKETQQRVGQKEAEAPHLSLFIAKYLTRSKAALRGSVTEDRPHTAAAGSIEPFGSFELALSVMPQVLVTF